jgi:hypothetical protein
MSDPQDKPAPPTRADFEQDLEPELEGKDRQTLLTVAVHLADQRPVPRPGIRSAIRSRLLTGGSRRPPARISALVLAYGSAGALLLAVAAVGLAGVGPFAA